jgi:asparagine synthase (glutamine-hydrolysing)
MCGISGFVDLARSTTRDHASHLIAEMTLPLAHRGPDDSGTWVDAAEGIALGHSRLSIIDLTDAGAQPMTSASDRYVITYNGEIYNFAEIATELEAAGHRLRGHCDTEVLIEAIDAFGLSDALERANGMFAFALWDRRERRLHLVRDRLGEKPLYYGWFGDVLLFASELKSLRAHPAFVPEIDRGALTSYLRFSCVPAPQCIFRHVRKLPPGSILTIDQDRHPRDARPVPYWSALDAFEPAQRLREIPEADAVDAATELVRDAVRLRMRSDVPLGAFLSGGIDSATVVALMQAETIDPVQTFTIGTTSRAHNEADRAAAIAQHLGTDHHELIVTAQDAQAVITRLPKVYDEPFADSSQIPTLLVAELARQSVTVSLSGDGGDETFGGYDRYRLVPRVNDRMRGVPLALRRMGANVADRIPPRAWDVLTNPLPARFRPQIPATKVHKLSAIAVLDSPRAMYQELISHWEAPAEVVIGGTESWTLGDEEWEANNIVERMMAHDTVTYLPDDILVKLDRATMSVSLEGRIPFLDHRLVELMARMPARMKIRDDRSKWVLRQILERHVPASLFAGPKSGFGVPIGAWLRGDLRPWAEELLSRQRLDQEGYLRPGPIRVMWAEHLSGRRDWGYHLWDVLMLEAWLDENRA